MCRWTSKSQSAQVTCPSACLTPAWDHPNKSTLLTEMIAKKHPPLPFSLLLWKPILLTEPVLHDSASKRTSPLQEACLDPTERNDRGSPGLEPSQLGVYLVHQLPFGVKTIPQNQNLLMMGFPEKG
ncbi:uncharacterized protein AAG666_000289 isoform 1-T1 [Megaptera novaeangliae]